MVIHHLGKLQYNKRYSLFSNERHIIFKRKNILVHHGYSVVLEAQYPVVNICKYKTKYIKIQNILTPKQMTGTILKFDQYGFSFITE